MATTFSAMVQITPYTLRLLFSYASQMRDAQKDFFRTKSTVFLSQAIKYEKKFDRLLSVLEPLVADWDGTWEELLISHEQYIKAFPMEGGEANSDSGTGEDVVIR